ncbi:GSCOCG00003630001-RA-CDS, partial [Cotesia congregata]
MKKFKRAYVYSSDSESDELSNGEKSIQIKDKFIEETKKKTFQSQKALHPKKLAKVTKSGVNNEDDAIPSCSFHNLPPKNLDKVEKNLAKTEKNLGILDKNFDTW